MAGLSSRFVGIVVLLLVLVSGIVSANIGMRTRRLLDGGGVGGFLDGLLGDLLGGSSSAGGGN